MEVDNYIKFLRDEELEVEYSLHNIDIDDPEADKKIRNDIEKEFQYPKLPLGKSHIIGGTAEEVALGRATYESLEKIIATTQDPSPELLQQVYYRSLHWRKRLQRLKNSFGEGINVANQMSKFRRLSQEAQNALKGEETAGAIHSESEVKSDVSATNINKAKKSSLNAGNNHQGTSNSQLEPTRNIDHQRSRTISERSADYSTTNLGETTLKTAFERASFRQDNRSPPPDDYNYNTQEAVGSLRSKGDGYPLNYQYRHYQPRWKLNFDGTPNGLDVHDFIFRLDTFAKRDGYPPHRLPAIIHSFVTDTAEKWLWAYTRDNLDASWPDMRRAFISRFSSHETEREKKRFIERYKQNHSSFNDYSLEVQSLNGRLSDRFTETELIELLRENMHPALRTVTLQLHFDTVEHLRRVCQQYERLWSKSGFDLRNTVESHSRRPRVNEIVSHSAGEGNLLNMSQPNELEKNTEINALHQNTEQSPGANYLICWNCKDIGHRYQDCTKEFLEIFCFGCGRKGVRKPNCSNCVKYGTGNYAPGAAYAGTARPGQTSMPRK